MAAKHYSRDRMKKIGSQVGNIRGKARPQRFELGANCYHRCDGWGLALNNKRCRNGIASRLGNETLSNEKYREENPITDFSAAFCLCCFQIFILVFVSSTLRETENQSCKSEVDKKASEEERWERHSAAM